VADWLIRHSDVPVLLARPKETAPDLSAVPVVPRVLIPLDGAELAEQILEPATTLGTLLGADFALVRVIKPMLMGNCDVMRPTPEFESEALLKQLQAMHEQCRLEAEKHIEDIAKRLREKGLGVRTSVLAREQPAVAILEQAHTDGAGLIAMATHGRGGLARLLLGSVADKVLRGAEIPVLVRRPAPVPHVAPAKERHGRAGRSQQEAVEQEEFHGCLHGAGRHAAEG
jgi:nucleotide-binding universal stress UspA family protein